MVLKCNDTPGGKIDNSIGHSSSNTNDSSNIEMMQVLTLSEEEYRHYLSSLKRINNHIKKYNNNELFYSGFGLLELDIQNIKKQGHITETIETELPKIGQKAIRKTIETFKNKEETISTKEYSNFWHDILEKVESNIDNFRTGDTDKDTEFQNYLNKTKKWLNSISSKVIKNTIYNIIGLLEDLLKKIENQDTYNNKKNSIDEFFYGVKDLFQNERKSEDKEERQEIEQKFLNIEQKINEFDEKYKSTYNKMRFGY